MGRGGVLARCPGDRSGGGLGADARLPLGMYAVAGMYLGRVDDLPIVEWTGRAWLWVALTAWPLVLLAVLHALFTTGGRNRA
ncbi:hypothetical protein ACWDTQ_01205 [Streptomyces cellulosae]